MNQGSPPDTTSMPCSRTLSSRRRSVGDADAVSTIAHAMSSFGITRDKQEALEIIVESIQLTGLPGLIDLVGVPEYLGQGAQYVVHKDIMVQTEHESFSLKDVAVKQAKFDLDPDEPLDLANAQARRKLHDIYLEIIALTVPRLRRHPNIARLLGWGSSSRTFHNVPLLIMDLAHANLAALLAQNKDKLSIKQKLLMCHDVGLGLDAIHECGLVHGDLKPENVLVFLENERFVAKLADFGLSVQEMDKQRDIYLGGTPGWSAPEVAAGEALEPGQLFQTDTYSFGLLIWSVAFRSGKMPSIVPVEEIQRMVNEDFEAIMAKTDFDWRDLYTRVRQMLQKDPCKRPICVSPLLHFEPEDLPLFRNDQHSSDGVSVRPAPNQNFKYFDWELSPLPQIFLHGLRSRVLKDPDEVPADMLFVVFMAHTEPPRCYLQPPEPDTTVQSDHSAVKALLEAAAKGQVSARSTLSPAYRYFAISLPAEVNGSLLQWLISSLSKGHLIVKQQLTAFGFTDFEPVLDDFRLHGGYHQYYNRPIRDDWTARASKISRSGKEQASRLHLLAATGTLEELQYCLSTTDGTNIDAMSEQLETPLYLACVRGDWPIARTLLQHGAKPSLPCTIFGVTCLHWLFAMREDLQLEAATVLVKQGAEINAKVAELVPFPFYPFSLPAGSPVHWAIVTQNKMAIKALIDQGADLLLRDGSDPYRFDDRVRVLDKFGGVNGEAFSISDYATQGLSPLDYAAMCHESSVFELILSLNRGVDVNATDEEGFALLHRLSALVVHHTRLGTAFSIRPFQGGSYERRSAIRSTVRTIVALEGSLEQLTTGSALKTYESQPGWVYPRFTPLMLAVKNGSVEVVLALLEAGASISTKNDLGKTALHYLPDDEHLAFECAQVLHRYGADINARDRNGETPVVAAAVVGSVSAVDLLLSLGADIDSRLCNPKEVRRGQSIFGLLARKGSGRTVPGDDPDTELDKTIARMLEQYVFACSDTETRERVMNVGQPGMTTLLHAFATNGLTRCVKALLDYGVVDLALNRCYEWETRTDGSRVRIDVFETAMQCTLRQKERDEARMKQDHFWSVQTYEKICRDFDQVLSLLRSKSALAKSNDGGLKLSL